MTEPSYEVITTEEQAAKVKAEVSTDAAEKKWRYVVATANASIAVAVANNPPAQQAGEAVFSV
ncbi:MAG TPA: hypothetical protein VHI11_07005, partial [Jiangellaceae bacterium]|nr:hypothetical protein [Jiangellaceae bacterium]